MCSWPTLALFVEHLGVARDAVATSTGVLVFAAGLPAMLAATRWAHFSRRAGLLPMLSASLLLTGVANVATGFAADWFHLHHAVGSGAPVLALGSVLVLRACGGFAMAGFVPLAFEWMHGFAPAGARGRVAGLGSTAMMVGNVLGPLLGGWLAVHAGLGATFWAPGVALTAVGLLLAVRPSIAGH
jgi:MFS family permease